LITCPDKKRKSASRTVHRAAQHGFSIITAIFLLVIMAALGAFMLTFSTVQHTTSIQDLQGSRAYQAARTGIEWGVYKVMSAENTTATPYDCTPASTTLPDLGGGLSNFTVTVQCAMTSDIEGTNTIRVYRITSTATSKGLTPGSANYVERELRAIIPTCRVSAAATAATC